MRLPRLLLVLVALSPAASAQEYKIEPLKEGPPAGLSGPVKGAMRGEGFRVTDGDGKTLADIWLRKGTPASEKPGGPKAAIQFPFLEEGELLGALRYAAEGHDYRDQTIPPGVYTLRFGIQPQNGAHLGVSTYRDYALLLPAAKDTQVATLPKKKAEEQSAESAGTSHPGVLMMLMAPKTAPAGPTMVRDDALNTWAAVVPLDLSVKGGGAETLPVQIVVVGAKMD